MAGCRWAWSFSPRSLQSPVAERTPGYLLKLLTNGSLPDTMSRFFDLDNICFPSVYDINHLTKFCGVTDSGLDDLANILDVKSARISHKEGSDSFLTALCFSELRQGFFNGSAEKYGRVLFGLGAVNSTSWVLHLPATHQVDSEFLL